MTTSQQLTALGYTIRKNSKGYYAIFKDGYRQHKTQYCTPGMAEEILNKHKDK